MGRELGWETAEIVQVAVLGVVLVAAVVLAVVLLRPGGPWARRRTRLPRTTQPWLEPVEPGRPRLAVVANPTKIPDAGAARAWVAARCAAAGWADPLWLETTVEDPGLGQARQAVEAGAAVVVAWGGDGTVRAVTAALMGSEVPLALLPAGTGNLLARNLGVPVADRAGALAVALGPHTRRIDVARAGVDVSGEDQDVVPTPFLVMAGLGFDAEVMASVEPRLKERVGWWAYVVAGVRNLRGRETRVRLVLDTGPPLSRRLRSIVVGNCGELTGGVRLLPSAQVDDGWLDVVVVSPRLVFGWAAVTAAVLTRGRYGHRAVEHFRCRRLEIRPEHPLQVQLDGDPLGTARALRVDLAAGSLLVKTPPRNGADRPAL